MEIFDPFNATLAQAKAQPDPYSMRGPIHRWGAAQRIIEKKAYFEQHPIEGVASCVRHALVVPDWLAVAFIRQDDQVLMCKVKTWDEAVGPAHLTHHNMLELLSLNTGVCHSELLSLTWENVDLKRKTIALLTSHSEGSAMHTIELNDQALLDMLMKVRPKSKKGLVFKSREHLSTLQVRREYKDLVKEMFTEPEPIEERYKLPELPLVKFTSDVLEGEIVTFAASEYYLLVPMTQEHVNAGRAHVLDDVSARKVRDRIEAELAQDVEKSSALPRTYEGRTKGAEILGGDWTEKKVRNLLGTTRANATGPAEYWDVSSRHLNGTNPFSIAKKKVPK